jgi:membrane peptidoglycan carboxypeptidase
MAQLNVISRSEAQAAKSRGIGLNVTPGRNGCVSSVSPFFCDYAVNYLMADPALGKTVDDRRRLLNTGGLTIHTTINMRMQRAADRAMRKHVYATDHAIGGEALVVPGSGEVRALSQSRPMGNNKRHGQTYLNYVVPPKYGDSNGFQAGSTFKAFVLSAAIKQGIPLSTQINAPQSISLPVDQFRRCSGYIRSGDVWNVQNSTGAGTFDLYSGTRQSVNTFFAQLEQRVGLCEPVRLARAMGVSVPESQVFPPFTLGITDTDPLTMASAYATFAARGLHCNDRPVTSVQDSAGKTIETYPKQCKQVLPSDVADAVNDILRGVQEPGGFGYDNGLELNQPSAGKTGTTDSNRAVWFIGYTPNLAGAVMLAGANSLGHWMTLNGQTVGGLFIEGAHGSTNAGPIWGDTFHAIENMLPNTPFHSPNPVTIKGQTATVPTVYGFSPSHAMQVLRAAGFHPVLGPTVNSSNPQGSVAYLSPGSGSQVPTGTPITIYVSDGTPYVPPPTNNGPGTTHHGNGNGGGGNGGGGGGPGKGH